MLRKKSCQIRQAYFEIKEIRNPPVGALKIYGGREIKKLARNLPDTTPVVGDDDYKKLKQSCPIHAI